MNGSDFMNIAICDDDMHMISQLGDIINDCFLGETNRYTCDSFLSGEELLKSLGSQMDKYQIYILDIELKQISGLQIASIIRRQSINAIIIFVTSHHELMQEAFDVVAFHFLIKPLDIEKTKKVLLRALEYLDVKKCIFQFKKGKKIYSLYYEEIICFESIKRKVCITAKDKIYEYYGTLKDVMNVVNLQYFVQVHNSFIVNMEYVETVDGECVILKTKQRISITKKFYKSFNAAYRNYILKRLK